MKYGFRQPRSTQERRQESAADEQGVKVRAKRRGHNLPDSYDDISVAFQGRCWKKLRKTQYRPKAA